ncbi:MAG: deacylase [Phycisphaera sp.]|nr:deacylase [Phycisphaera sp.]
MSVTVGDVTIRPGHRQRIELPVARLPTQTEMNLPVEVVNGARPGPRLWISAAIHGDELNGVEIIQRVLDRVSTKTLYGELIAVPIVNVFGFINQQRYMTDRRDLNRSFPGSKDGSLASRLAFLFMKQIVSHCTHGIDLHTASHHRTNLPQVRGNLYDPETRRIAEAFGAPIMIHGDAPAGSLRQAVAKKNIPIITYEAGEPHRFNSDAIDVGVKGILRVMAELGMRGKPRGDRPRQSMIAEQRTWVRAHRSGIFRINVKLGQWVSQGDTLGTIRDAFGAEKGELLSPANGLVIGHTHNPMVSQGDGIVHLATDVATHMV